MSQTNGDNRKIIFLGMPCAGEMTMGAAVGFHRCTRRKEHHVELLALSSSLATGNMNGLWCHALNMARKGRLDYFAMVHSDIEPPEFWIDTAIDELEAKNLDVLGVVAPIKDNRGLTTTAVADPGGDPWKVRNRLTMTEVYRLPETFTSEDVGGPLLINTGLWVCRFNMEWAPRVYFTVNDRIMVDRKTGDYVAQIEPEDWFVSRLYHELGLRVGCTRKIPLHHRGSVGFANDHAWGRDEFDKQWADKSFLDGQARDWFPHAVSGWLTELEGRELARLADGKVCLEIGAYAGRSTICLAQHARSVSVIDTFDGRGTAMEAGTRRLFETNIRAAGVFAKVTIHEGESAAVLPCLPPAYDLVFIDGSHDKDSVLADAEAAARLLRPGGVLVFHDYGGQDFGVTEAVDEVIAGGGKLLSRCGTLAVVRPPAAVGELTHA